MPFLRVCPICGKEFIVQSRTRGIYCSKQCSGSGSRPPRPLNICVRCGKQFKPKNRPDQPYCSRTCSAETRRKPIGPEYKRRCTSCNEEFPATREFFGYNGKNALAPCCLVCSRIHKKEQVSRDPEKYRQFAKNSYVKHRDKRKEAGYRYYEKNRSKVREYKNQWQIEHAKSTQESKRKYRENNRDKAAAWAKANADKIRGYKHKYKAKKRELPRDFTPNDWRYCLEWWNYRCAYCGSIPKDRQTLAQDHFVSLYNDGAYTRGNIVPACHGIDGCNNSKADRHVRIWLLTRYDTLEVDKILNKIADYFAHIATLSTSDISDADEIKSL